MNEIAENQKPLIPIIRSLAVPVFGLVVLAVIDSQVRSGLIRMAHIGKALEVGYILLGIGLGYRLICSVALDVLLARTTGRQVPKILKHLIGICAAILAALLAINVVFTGAITGLLALSSIIAVVIGLALRPIILDIFSGLSANLDPAFHIGDWIEINGRSETYIGWVEEINWRTTHLKTRSGNLIICPNGTLSTAIIINYARPIQLSRFDVSVKLPPELDPDRIRRILTAAVEATLDTEDGPSSTKAPEVFIAGLDASGAEYRLRFWLDPSKKSPEIATHAVLHSVLRHLQIAGIPLAENVIQQRDTRIILDIVDLKSRAELIGRIPLFSGMQAASQELLAKSAALHNFAHGEVLIRQGDTDSDMFLLVEGAVDVLIEVDGKERLVAKMQAGDYFGEMSLLTGDARTATVSASTGGAAYRIGREAIIAVLESDPDLMNLLSRNLAERNINRQSKAAVADEQSSEQKRISLAAVLLAKMMGIFRK